MTPMWCLYLIRLAGIWQKSYRAQTVPNTIILLHLPPYSPELNCVLRLWAYLKNHYFSNRTDRDYDDLFDTPSTAWNTLLPEQFKSICRTAWLHKNYSQCV